MKALLNALFCGCILYMPAMAQSEPWQDPSINQINREPMHAHFIPFRTEKSALSQQRQSADTRFVLNEKNERRISLDGTWKFCWSPNPQSAPADFYKPGYNLSKFKKIMVPGSW